MYRLFLALRWLASRPINLLGVAGVTLGVWALIVVVSIFAGYGQAIAEHVRGAGSDVSIYGIQPGGPPWTALDHAVCADPEVVAVAPRLLWYGMVHPRALSDGVSRDITLPGDGPSMGSDTPFQQLIGIHPERELATTELHRWLTDPAIDAALRVGDPHAPLAPVDGVPTILLSQERMVHQRLRPGDRVRLTTGAWVRSERSRKLTTSTQEFVVAGAFHTRHVGFDVANALVSFEWLAELLRLDPEVDAHELAVALDPSVRDDPNAVELASTRIGRTVRRMFQDQTSRMPRVVTWERRNIQFLSSIEHQGSLMKLVLFVILVVAAFLMFATLSMMVTEKTRDIGILSAMGASPLGVLQVFLLCGLTITVTGVILGLSTGALSSLYLDSFNTFMKDTWGVDLFPTRIYHLDRVPYTLDPVWMAQVAGMALATGVLVSGIPAIRAALQHPVRPLRQE